MITNNAIVIIEKETGRAVVELLDGSLASKINKDKYTAVPVLEYLVSLNA